MYRHPPPVRAVPAAIPMSMSIVMVVSFPGTMCTSTYSEGNSDKNRLYCFGDNKSGALPVHVVREGCAVNAPCLEAALVVQGARYGIYEDGLSLLGFLETPCEGLSFSWRGFVGVPLIGNYPPDPG
jgi:hypothetical protein